MDLTALTAFLAAALPFLLRGAETAGEEAANSLGAGAW
jgi:hypothetical protein